MRCVALRCVALRCVALNVVFNERLKLTTDNTHPLNSLFFLRSTQQEVDLEMKLEQAIQKGDMVSARRLSQKIKRRIGEDIEIEVAMGGNENKVMAASPEPSGQQPDTVDILGLFSVDIPQMESLSRIEKRIKKQSTEIQYK